MTELNWIIPAVIIGVTIGVVNGGGWLVATWINKVFPDHFEREIALRWIYGIGLALFSAIVALNLVLAWQAWWSAPLGPHLKVTY